MLKTNLKTEVSGFGFSSMLDLVSKSDKLVSNFYINYENLNSGARHEYSVSLKIVFIALLFSDI